MYNEPSEFGAPTSQTTDRQTTDGSGSCHKANVTSDTNFSGRVINQTSFCLIVTDTDIHRAIINKTVLRVKPLQTP